MSGTGPESIPVSADPRSRRPTKKRALTPTSQQATQLDSLFRKPDQDIRIPPSAADAARRRLAPPPPEIVTNVQGSSAGAGSGEFHVYKAARRREYERLRVMDEEVRREEEQRDFEDERARREEEDKRKTERNRAKREKMKARKDKAKGAKKTAGKPGDGASGAPGGAGGAGGIKPRVVQSEEDGQDGAEGGVKMDVDPSKGAAIAAGEATTSDASGLVIHEDD